MVIGVRTEHGPQGLEIVKEGTTTVERERLAGEATWLRRAAHPGVVDVVSAADGELRLRHRGTPLARLVPLPPDHSAAVVRAVAETVADLHRQGVAHGRISADHVVVGERGRPVLCGFAEASEATDDARAADVAAIGCLLDELLDSGADLPWAPGLRGARHARRRARATRALRSAAAAARRDDPAQRPEAHHLATTLLEALPEMRLPAPPTDPAASGPRRFTDIPEDFDPTADLGWSDDDLSFLSVIDETDEEWVTGQHAVVDPDSAPAAVPPPPVFSFDDDAAGAASDGDDVSGSSDRDARPAPPREPPVITIRPASPRPSQPRARDRRLLLGVAAVVLVLGAVAGAIIVRSVRPFGAADPLATSATTPVTVAMDPEPPDTSVPSPEPTTVPTHPPACTVPELPGPDVDGDDCPEPVQLDERTATVGTVQVELGEPGDVVAVADTDCDGVATPVVLRPGTGEVFLFPRWSLREPLEVRAATVVPGGERLSVGDGDCPAVSVTGDGVRRVVAGTG